MPYHPLELADAFIQAGELDDALAALTEYLAKEPGDEAARRLRIDVLIRQHDSKHLEMALDDLHTLSEQTTEDIMLASTVLERLERYTDCLNLLQSGHERWPSNARLAERTVQMLYQQGDFVHAYAIVEPFLETDDWRWLQWAGDLMAASNNFTTAIDHYTAALQNLNQNAAPQDISATHPLAGAYARLLIVRAEAYQNVNRIALAHVDYAAALSLVPDDPVIAFKLGLTLIQQGETPAGINHCLAAWKSAQKSLRDELQELVAQLPTDHPLSQYRLEE